MGEMDKKNLFQIDDSILKHRKVNNNPDDIPEKDVRRSDSDNDIPSGQSQVCETVVLEDDADLGDVIEMEAGEVFSVSGNADYRRPSKGNVREDPDTIHIEIGEMTYDPKDGEWKEEETGTTDYGWRIRDGALEKDAEYRLISEDETSDVRRLPDKSAGKKKGAGKKKVSGKKEDAGKKSTGRKRDKKPKKKYPLYLQIIYGIIVLACLGASFVYPCHYLSTVIASSSEAAGGEEAVVGEVSAGTWCTLKSNSLDGVPVYAEPGDTAQIAFIPEGKYVQLLENTVAGKKSWACVDYCGITAWLPMSRLHFISEGQDYIRTGSLVYMNSITEKGIDLYEGSSPDSGIVAEGIRYGAEFTVSELKGGWGRVEYKGQPCWINMYHMGSYGTTHWKVETLSTAQAINLRKEPDGEAGLLCKIPEETELTIREFKDGWGQVDYDGNTGWVMLHYLTPIE